MSKFCWDSFIVDNRNKEKIIRVPRVKAETTTSFVSPVISHPDVSIIIPSCKTSTIQDIKPLTSKSLLLKPTVDTSSFVLGMTPRGKSDLINNKIQYDQLVKWISCRVSRQVDTPKACFLYGDHGTGKTAFVRVALKSQGFDIIEIDSGSLEIADSLVSKILEVAITKCFGVKKAILVDDLDSILSIIKISNKAQKERQIKSQHKVIQAEYVSLGNIIEMLHRLPLGASPIIFTCRGTDDKVIREIANVCLKITWYTPNTEEMIGLASRVKMIFNLDILVKEQNLICAYSNGDIRQLLNNLQVFTIWQRIPIPRHVSPPPNLLQQNGKSEIIIDDLQASDCPQAIKMRLFEKSRQSQIQASISPSDARLAFIKTMRISKSHQNFGLGKMFLTLPINTPIQKLDSIHSMDPDLCEGFAFDHAHRNFDNDSMQEFCAYLEDMSFADQNTDKNYRARNNPMFETIKASALCIRGMLSPVEPMQPKRTKSKSNIDVSFPSILSQRQTREKEMTHITGFDRLLTNRPNSMLFYFVLSIIRNMIIHYKSLSTLEKMSLWQMFHNKGFTQQHFDDLLESGRFSLIRQNKIAIKIDTGYGPDSFQMIIQDSIRPSITYGPIQIEVDQIQKEPKSTYKDKVIKRKRNKR